MKIEKIETHYRVNLNVSEYDFLEIISNTQGRITIKFLESRWRTPKETIKLLKEIINTIEQNKII